MNQTFGRTDLILVSFVMKFFFVSTLVSVTILSLTNPSPLYSLSFQLIILQTTLQNISYTYTVCSINRMTFRFEIKHMSFESHFLFETFSIKLNTIFKTINQRIHRFFHIICWWWLLEWLEYYWKTLFSRQFLI